MNTVKLLFLFTLSLGLGSIFSFAQWANKDANKSKPKKFEDFHSNLGQQGIVELRIPRPGLSGKTRSRRPFRAKRKPSVQSSVFCRRVADGPRAFFHEKKMVERRACEEKAFLGKCQRFLAPSLSTNNASLAVG